MGNFINNNRHLPEVKLLLAVVDSGFIDMQRYWKGVKEIEYNKKNNIKNKKEIKKSLKNTVEADYKQAVAGQFWTKSHSENFIRIYNKLKNSSWKEINGLKIDHNKSY